MFTKQSNDLDMFYLMIVFGFVSKLTLGQFSTNVKSTKSLLKHSIINLILFNQSPLFWLFSQLSSITRLPLLLVVNRIRIVQSIKVLVCLYNQRISTNHFLDSLQIGSNLSIDDGN